MSQRITGCDEACALASFCDLLDDNRIIALLHHWQAARGDRLMPAWSDIDLTELRHAAPIIWSWSYDRDSDSFTGRLAGQKIRELVGKPITGKAMADYFSGWNYAEIFARHKRVVADCAVALERGLVFCRGEHQGTGERLILPLAADGIHPDGLIGATAYATVPRQFDRLFNPGSYYHRYQAMLGGADTEYFPLNTLLAQGGTGPSKPMLQ